MKLSKLFTRTLKENPREETSLNAQLLMRAGFIDKLAAGIYTFLPLGLRVHNKICQVVRQEIDDIDGQELLMPALTPREVWDTTGRWESFDALFKLKGNDGKEYALGATHEEIVTPTVAKHVFSYKDLPCAVYQIQTKFRNELRAKAGLMRGREFSMKDLYSFHANEEDLNEYYKLAQKAYFRIFERLGLLDVTYLTYSSGGAFSKYSHEFQAVTPAGEDTIHICDACKIAVNQEIVVEVGGCPSCGNKDLHSEKAVEIGNIFKLGTRFTKPFEFTYLDANGQDQPVIMGCYGLGPSRLMGTIVEISHDDKGMIWPREVAPYLVHLISLKQNEAVEKLYQSLAKAGIEALYDDRELSAGEKFAEADLMGMPYRVLVSEKTLAQGSAEVKTRATGQVEIIKLDKLVEYLVKQ
ncbi:MAG: aminoacyl--tRNA ligase-related protein [Candidatus Falkowbacteria bacterium]